MPAFKVELFGGMAPAVDSKLLPVNGAAHAVNAWLDIGVLTGFNKLQLLVTAPIPELGKAYRIPEDYDSPYIVDASKWMFFENPDTDIIRGATFGDIYDRYYWASSSGPPQYNTRDRIFADDPPWLLGIPTPPHAMDLLITGGGATTTVTRSYVITFVSEYGEEGAPSPPVTDTGKPDAIWTLSNIPEPDPDDMGVDRNITARRIYRTVTSSAGIASFFMLIEIAPTGVVNIADTTPDSDITSNKILDTVQFTGPPSDLEGFCMGPNGIIAGWRGSEVWFSEPYRPHAWPAAYVLMVEYPIVGMASIGSAFYVMTRGYPVVISGSAPLSMLPLKVTVFEPCTSRGGIVTFPEGVYYPSGNGLILLQAGAASNITKTLITKERWQAYVQGARFRAGRLGSAYYGYGTAQFGVFQEDTFQNDAFAMEDFLGAMNGIFIDPMNPRLGLILLQSDEAVNNVQNDAWSSELGVIKGNKVYWLNLMQADQVIEPATWHSKDFQLPWPFNLAAAKIYFDVPASTPPQNPVRDEAQDQVLTEGKYAIVRWFGNENQIAMHEIRTRGELLRLPSDRKYDYFRFEIETRVEITSVHLGSSAKALREV